MTHLLRNSLISISAYVAISLSNPAVAAQSDVLDINEINNADITTLLEDTKMFNTIGMGIALSIAECTGKDICEPTVDEGEIGQLIEALDRRIEGVISREQNDEEELSTIRTAYIDTRDKYSDYMERLSKISRPELPQDEFVGEEDLFTNEGALSEDEYSAFDDFEEDLEDDEELEDDLDPENN